MTLPSGGWLADETVGSALESMGVLTSIFNSVIVQGLTSYLTTKEIFGTLTAPEKLLQADLVSGGTAQQALISRVTYFIRQDGGGSWGLHGLYMTSADITTVINSAWANILKKYS